MADCTVFKSALPFPFSISRVKVLFFPPKNLLWKTFFVIIMRLEWRQRSLTQMVITTMGRTWQHNKRTGTDPTTDLSYDLVGLFLHPLDDCAEYTIHIGVPVFEPLWCISRFPFTTGGRGLCSFKPLLLPMQLLRLVFYNCEHGSSEN